MVCQVLVSEWAIVSAISYISFSCYDNPWIQKGQKHLTLKSVPQFGCYLSSFYLLRISLTWLFHQVVNVTASNLCPLPCCHLVFLQYVHECVSIISLMLLKLPLNYYLRVNGKCSRILHAQDIAQSYNVFCYFLNSLITHQASDRPAPQPADSEPQLDMNYIQIKSKLQHRNTWTLPGCGKRGLFNQIILILTRETLQ